MARSAKQLRWLFASGVLTSGSRAKGKGGGVQYHPKRAKAIRAASGKGSPSQTYRSKTGRAANLRHNHSTNAMKAGQFGGRAVIGGKTAGLRGGGGSGGKTKPDFSSTRVARIAAGRSALSKFGESKRGMAVAGGILASGGKGRKTKETKIQAAVASATKGVSTSPNAVRKYINKVTLAEDSKYRTYLNGPSPAQAERTLNKAWFIRVPLREKQSKARVKAGKLPKFGFYY